MNRDLPYWDLRMTTVFFSGAVSLPGEASQFAQKEGFRCWPYCFCINGLESESLNMSFINPGFPFTRPSAGDAFPYCALFWRLRVHGSC